MHKQVIRRVFISLLALTPLAAMAPRVAMAQASVFDDTTIAIVESLAQRVAPFVNPGLPWPEGTVISSDTPEDVDDEPIDEPVELPELNLTDLVEYSSQGVTIKVPADWEVETDLREGSPFLITVPGTDIGITLEADNGLDFPSWLGIALFRSQAELLTESMGEDVQIEESATLYTEQSLPIAKLSFSGLDDSDESAGTLYVLAPNESAYLLLIGGIRDEWAYASPGVDLIAESIVFDEDLVSVVLAGDEPLSFTDEDETVEVSIPAGWYGIGTGDEQFPVILAEPEVRYVVAIGTEQTFGGSFDPDILEKYVPAEGELDPADYDDLIAEISDLVADSGSPILLDEDSSAVTTREGAVTVQLVGEADLGDGVAMPVIMYINLESSGVGVAVVFGDTESALEVTETIQAVLESVTGL